MNIYIYLLFYLNTQTYIFRSYDDLLIVDKKVCGSFKDACVERGLFNEEDEYQLSMREVAESKGTPEHLRHLYVTMLVSGTANAISMLDEHCFNMTLDFYQDAKIPLPMDKPIKIVQLPQVV